MDQFINRSDVAFTIFTGDIVSHDNDDQLSRAYVEYEESVTYAVFKAEMGNSPIYPTLGNHDSLPEAFNTPNNINGGNNGTNNTFSWNYNLLSSMWAQDGWINATEQQYAATRKQHHSLVDSPWPHIPTNALWNQIMEPMHIQRLRDCELSP